MSADDVVALVIALLVGAYLVVALLFPERLG
jgi:K+-transporting ATPase KdpF subunit